MSYSNNVKSTLNAAVLASATSVQVVKASSPYNDPPTSGNLTLMDNLASPSKIEIITYTGRTDNTTYWTLTGVSKGQDGTSDQAWSSGDNVFQSWIASDANIAVDSITDKGLYEHANTISANYTITSGNNALTAGPITINTGVSVTVPTGSTWVVS